MASATSQLDYNAKALKIQKYARMFNNLVLINIPLLSIKLLKLVFIGVTALNISIQL